MVYVCYSRSDDCSRWYTFVIVEQTTVADGIRLFVIVDQTTVADGISVGGRREGRREGEGL